MTAYDSHCVIIQLYFEFSQKKMMDFLPVCRWRSQA